MNQMLISLNMFAHCSSSVFPYLTLRTAQEAI